MGWWEDGVLKTEEVYRFKNGVDEKNGHLVWNVERLEREVRAGIDAALEKCPEIESLSIDTWGGLCAFPGRRAGVSLLCLPGQPH